MYRAIGVEKFARYFTLTVGLAFLALWLWDRPSEVSVVWRQVSLAIAIVTALTLAMGQTAIFPWLCRKTVLGRIFPDIDGEWHVELKSNWPAIAKLIGIIPDETATIGAMKIKARLFTIKLRYTSVSPRPSYLISKTRSVSIERDADDGFCRLLYVYEAEVTNPEATDSGHHYGAAYIDLMQSRAGSVRYHGAYWTNRNWTDGLNTAGVIDLLRD
ncbi:MAG: hypothetical protein QOD42_1742 [Sphingomonadales bacterium]|jgi:hypothetical protein|nr:hypothetical protein [Sphingomonadales bacterium]